jgi:hypothetical protein
MFLSLLAAIYNFLYCTKYLIETESLVFKFSIILHGHLVRAMQHGLTYGQSYLLMLDFYRIDMSVNYL